MKKWLLLLLLCARLAYGAEDVLDKDELAAPSGDDILYVIDDPAGTPLDKKATVTNVVKGGLPQACTDGQVVEWDDAGSIWVCGDNDGVTDHGALTGLTDNDHSAVYCLYTVSNVDPGAGAVASACHIWVNDAVTPKRIFYGEGVGQNFEDFAALGDAYGGLYAGSTEDATASGSESLRFLRAASLATEVKIFNGTATFTNQPANDGLECLSSNAADTAQNLVIYGTTQAGDASSVTIETINLDGTNQVSTVKTDWGFIWAAQLASVAVGTVTCREASGNQTVFTIAPAALVAADLDTVILK